MTPYVYLLLSSVSSVLDEASSWWVPTMAPQVPTACSLLIHAVSAVSSVYSIHLPFCAFDTLDTATTTITTTAFLVPREGRKRKVEAITIATVRGGRKGDPKQKCCGGKLESAMGVQNIVV